jgi:hypothetical protein
MFVLLSVRLPEGARTDGVSFVCCPHIRTAHAPPSQADHEPHGFSIFGATAASAHAHAAVPPTSQGALNTLLGDKKNRLILEADAAHT